MKLKAMRGNTSSRDTINTITASALSSSAPSPFVDQTFTFDFICSAVSN